MQKSSDGTNRHLHEHHREMLKNRIILHNRAQMIPLSKKQTKKEVEYLCLYSCHAAQSVRPPTDSWWTASHVINTPSLHAQLLIQPQQSYFGSLTIPSLARKNPQSKCWTVSKQFWIGCRVKKKKHLTRKQSKQTKQKTTCVCGLGEGKWKRLSRSEPALIRMDGI